MLLSEITEEQLAWYILQGYVIREQLSGLRDTREIGSRRFLFNGNLHRHDGPAFEWADGTKWYYLHGNRVSKQEFLKITKQTGCTIICDDVI